MKSSGNGEHPNLSTKGSVSRLGDEQRTSYHNGEVQSLSKRSRARMSDLGPTADSLLRASIRQKTAVRQEKEARSDRAQKTEIVGEEIFLVCSRPFFILQW